MRGLILLVVIVRSALGLAVAGEVPAATRTLIKQHCAECHDAAGTSEPGIVRSSGGGVAHASSSGPERRR